MLSFLAGYFEYVFILLFLITVHELGHLITATIFKFQIEKVKIYSFGGITKYNVDLNIEMYKELIVLILGPLTQVIVYYLIYFLYIKGYINPLTMEKISLIHSLLLDFNLLPIIPLDGGKMLNIILNAMFNYNLSNKIALSLSYIFLLIKLFCTNQTIIKVLLILILFKLIKETKNNKYRLNKFILERKLNNYTFHRIKRIKNIKNMYRSRMHYIIKDNIMYKEKEYLTNNRHL